MSVTEQIISQVMQNVIEIIVALGGLLASLALHKAKQYLDTLKKSDQTGIVSDVAFNVVHLAESQLTGKAGEDKLNFALVKLSQILATKKIKVTADELHAAIEASVAQLPKSLLKPTPEAAPVQEATPEVQK